MASKVLADCRPTDQLAVFAFDATARPLLSFHESATLDAGPVRPSPGTRWSAWRRPGAGPTWVRPLIDTVAAIEDVADTSEKAARMPRRVVLISDLAQGSRLDALGDFEWPSDVELDIEDRRRHRFKRGASSVLADAARGRAGGRHCRGASGWSTTRVRRENSSWSGSTTKERRRQSRSTFTFRREKAVSCACQCHQAVHRARRSG